MFACSSDDDSSGGGDGGTGGSSDAGATGGGNGDEAVLERSKGAVSLGVEDCTPGYYNNEGKLDERYAQSAPSGWTCTTSTRRAIRSCAKPG